MLEDGWIGLKLKKKKTLADISSDLCLEQAEEISGLCLRVKLRVRIRAEAGRVELRGLSDPDDIVEQAEEEETDEWHRVEV